MQLSGNNGRSNKRIQEVSTSFPSTTSTDSSESVEEFLLDIPTRVHIPTNLTRHSIMNLSYLSEGSSATVFTGFLNGEKVAVKVSSQSNDCTEIDLEHHLLKRLFHSNIVQIRGAGCSSSKFIVLEYLNGGSLNEYLEERRVIAPPQTKRSIFSYFKCKIAPTPFMKMKEVVSVATQIAQALEYLHVSWHPNACIIHRDLKPHNIIISPTGVVKLIDFGLMACVKKTTNIAEMYEMTGFVGSLRYMAPEVVNHRPYNEKVDIYSFGLIMWELSTGKVPFDGMTRETYMEKVVKGGFRPSLKGIHSTAMAELISKCWDSNFLCRPSSGEVLAKLNSLKL
eukprot:CAMPEP_0170063394 /NCGR_PEP_ID=MMETSP0019_2-20121128/4278_1 /TAXON_ID=98059 /ORGANISM="Dinobryon sp., Strain UTEXLB2267" /LENGTH=337 /DNA_ID=CAMNT_0010269813 /DNA_START=63 /DNA_END=1076 /DNA_ORIENTATION=+